MIYTPVLIEGFHRNPMIFSLKSLNKENKVLIQIRFGIPDILK